MRVVERDFVGPEAESVAKPIWLDMLRFNTREVVAGTAQGVRFIKVAAGDIQPPSDGHIPAIELEERVTVLVSPSIGDNHQQPLCCAAECAVGQ